MRRRTAKSQYASVGEGAGPCVREDLDDLIGTWEEDPAFDAALREQDQVDGALGS